MNETIQLRNGTLDELLTMLRDLDSQKMDMVVPSKDMMSIGGDLMIKGSDGVHGLKPTYSMDSQIASKLGIPFEYYKRMQQQRLGLYDSSVNSWLEGKPSYLVRSYLKENDISIGRALLSDKYKIIDNSVILINMLEAIKLSGKKMIVESADIDEKKMYVRFGMPDNTVEGGKLTENYRNPANRQTGDAVSGGFTLTNSETGFGSFSLMPRLNILICQNGMTRNAFGMRKMHLGAKLDDGLVDYSDNTKQKNLDLIMSQMNDFVQVIAGKDYLQDWVNELNAKVGEELKNPIQTVKYVASDIGINESQHDEILKYFTQSADTTYNGVIQSLNYFAHQQDNPEVQYDIERKLEGALDLIPKVDVLV